MAQHPYHSANSTEYMGTTSRPPTPFTQKTTDKHKGPGKGKDIKPRTRTIALSDVKVTRADGTTYIMQSRATRAASKRVAKRTTNKQRVVAEVAKMQDTRSMDEIRRLNGTD